MEDTGECGLHPSEVDGLGWSRRLRKGRGGGRGVLGNSRCFDLNGLDPETARPCALPTPPLSATTPPPPDTHTPSLQHLLVGAGRLGEGLATGSRGTHHPRVARRWCGKEVSKVSVVITSPEADPPSPRGLSLFTCSILRRSLWSHPGSWQPLPCGIELSVT